MAEFAFDLDLVTPRMLVDFKDKTGQNLLPLFRDGEFQIADLEPEALTGLIWIALRMSGQPDATWDQALDTPFQSLEFAEDGDEDPTKASDAT